MTRPDIHVMLMSGQEHGNLLVLNYGWAYIHKPFVATKLVQMIKDVLHSADRSQPGRQEFESAKDTGAKDVNPAAHLAVRTTAESDASPKAPLLDPEISRVMAERAEGARQEH
jgi:hypothetical protein